MRRSKIKLCSEKVANNLIILISKHERSAASPIKEDMNITNIQDEFKIFDNKATKIKNSYAQYIKNLEARINDVFLSVINII